jgi:hypothetical protein
MEVSKIFGKPKNEVMVDRDRLSLFERSLPLACTTSVRHIAAPGIQPLGRAIGIEEAHGDPGFP